MYDLLLEEHGIKDVCVTCGDSGEIYSKNIIKKCKCENRNKETKTNKYNPKPVYNIKLNKKQKN